MISTLSTTCASNEAMHFVLLFFFILLLLLYFAYLMHQFTRLKLNSWLLFFYSLHQQYTFETLKHKYILWNRIESNRNSFEQRSCRQFAMQRAQNDLMATSVDCYFLVTFYFFIFFEIIHQQAIDVKCIGFSSYREKSKLAFFWYLKRIRISFSEARRKMSGGNTSRKFTSMNFISTTTFHNECNNSSIWCNVTPNVQFSSSIYTAELRELSFLINSRLDHRNAL